MECVAGVRDCFTLPVQILQYTDSQLLNSTVQRFRASSAVQARHPMLLPRKPG